MNYHFEATEDFAKSLDAKDSLRHFKDRFYLPEKGIYMDGNSLGLLSKDSESSLLRVLDEFKKQGINGWMESEIPWFHYGEKLGDLQAPMVGALEGEVVVHATTTMNLHLLLATFFKPHQGRNKILIDELNFPSDIYAIESQLLLHNLNPADHLITVNSRDGRMIQEDDIINAMSEEVAVILLPSVLYRSGQLLDMERLTKEAHKKGILIGFDCCHSVGAVPHQFHDWGVDFAFWCNYKYMNNGPGGTASLFVHEKHFSTTPGLWGWWGYRKDKQFDMKLDFEPSGNAGGWQISTVNLFSAAPLEGSLKIFKEAGLDNIREKSLQLTEYMMYLIDEFLTKEPYNFVIGTPRDTQRRGGHVALEHATEAIRINEALKKRGVVPDFRSPNIIRLAPIALYNSYHDVWQVIQHVKEIMDHKEYEAFSKERNVVA